MSTFLNAYSTITHEVAHAPQAPSAVRSTVASVNSSTSDSTSEQPTAPHQADNADARAEIEHLQQFEQYVMQQGAQRAGQITANIIGLRNHIRNTHWHYVFEVADNFSAQNLGAFAEWAKQTNSVFVMNDLSVRDARGIDLLDPQVAFGDSAVKPPRPQAAAERMAKIRGYLWNNGIQIPQNLPAVWSEDELLLREAEEVFNRAVTASVVASIAKHVAEGKPVPFQMLEAGSHRTFQNLTPSEKNFVDAVRTEQPAELSAEQLAAQPTVSYSQNLVHAARPCLEFAFAAAETLGWVLNLTEQRLNQITEPDIPAMRKALRSVDREGRDASQLEFKPLPLIADNLEFSTCMRWWDVERPQNEAHTQHVSGRLHALSWLTSPNIDWDAIQLDV